MCISLLDPKRSFPSPPFYSFRGHHVYESPIQVNQETVGAMLPQLSEFCAYFFHALQKTYANYSTNICFFDDMSKFSGDLLKLLNVSLDEKVLPTTYGQLKPPLGKHRLKVNFFFNNIFCLFFNSHK